MLAIDLLTSRQSNAFLQAPPPSKDELALLFKAAMKVPDHGALIPWHFTVVQGEGLNKLSNIFVSSLPSDTDEAKKEKVKKMPFRAPLIIVVSTRIVEHDKVPKQEQIVAAGCTVHAMQMAAFSLGLGAMWRTGELSYNTHVKQQLNISSVDEIVGFLYVGTKSKELPQKPEKIPTPHIDFL